MKVLETVTTAVAKANIDPVCGMNVPPGRTGIVADYQGCSYYFCAEDCRTAFEINPRKYLEPKPNKRKGWWGRYMDRLAKANEKQLNVRRPKCC